MELNNTRARSPEKKQERFNQIMEVTNDLFLKQSYHDIITFCKNCDGKRLYPVNL